MEDGIEAIQPDSRTIAEDLLKSPSADPPEDEFKRGGFMSRYIGYPLIRIWYYFTLGPWLDKRARRAAEGFEWPEEVENLCGPNPDLHGLDVRPVKSRKDVFYTPDSFGYRLVDRNGQYLFDKNKK